MHFTTDRQTLEDLNIFGKSGADSIYGQFNQTQTRGGAILLEQLFHEPLSRVETIRRRIGIIRYFTGAGLSLPVRAELFDAIEQYLAITDERTKLSSEDGALGRRLAGMVTMNAEQAIIHKGVTAAVGMIHAARDFLLSFAGETTPYAEEWRTMQKLLSETPLVTVFQQPAGKKLAFEQLAAYDEVLRFRHRAVVRQLLDRLYYLDVCLTIARVAVKRNLAFPEALDRESHTIVLKGMYHPALSNPIPNSIHITPESNVVFLTGANMAGKSTFMKSFGITLYLAHMGFPVPAEEMTFSVLDGLFTTINLADNLGMGASHFYAEVLRVKKVAEELNRGRNLLVIFDELFRGTNVKDALEATIAITGAFASRRTSIFVVSTHIIEAGDVLRAQHDNISFRYLPTRMDDNRPIYTYQLEEGITDDRHGMVIIRNEGILDILENGMHEL